VERVKSGWDSGLDYLETYQRILSHLNRTRKPQDVVLLIQLRNGSRVGEAVEALREFCNTGKTEVLVSLLLTWSTFMMQSGVIMSGLGNNEHPFDFLALSFVECLTELLTAYSRPCFGLPFRSRSAWLRTHSSSSTLSLRQASLGWGGWGEGGPNNILS